MSDPKLYTVWISEPSTNPDHDSTVWARVEDAIEDLGLVMGAWEFDGKLIMSLERQSWTRERIQEAFENSEWECPIDDFEEST